MINTGLSTYKTMAGFSIFVINAGLSAYFAVFVINTGLATDKTVNGETTLIAASKTESRTTWHK